MARRIVICADGTWNRAEAKNPTNVALLQRALPTHAPDGVEQVVCYDPGVGTGGFLDRWVGGVTGSGIGKNVRDAYEALAANYQDGDDVYFFGFSRGAYTVRSALGMLRNCWLLKPGDLNRARLREAYSIYRGREGPDDERARRFREAHCREVSVKFLGVWDTVGALGIPVSWLNWLTRRKYQFHDVTLSRIVENAFHALSIDERRRVFRPSLWAARDVPGQRVQQKWFAGVHCDVGGGLRDTSLSDLALIWMLERAGECGLALDREYLESRSPAFDGRLHRSRPGFWQVLPSYTRPIGRNGNESVSDSALSRFRTTRIDYASRNLVEYFARVGASRPGDSPG